MAHFQEEHLHHLTGVVYPDLEQEQIRDGQSPKIKTFVKDKPAQLTFQRADGIASWTMPVSMSSLEILREKDAKTIKMLESVIEFQKRLNEVKSKELFDTLEDVLQLKDDLEFSELIRKQQAARILTNRDDAIDAEKRIDALEAYNRNASLELTQLRGQLDQSRNIQTKFEQATREAKKWKNAATKHIQERDLWEGAALYRAEEIERLANLVIERTNERNALSGKEQVEPYKTSPTITIGSVTDLEIPKFKTKPSGDLRKLDPLTVTVKWDTGFGLPTSIAGPTLGDRVSTLEAKVAELERPVPQYRILDPRERVAKGDEFRQNDSWIVSSLAGLSQQSGLTYRRKV